MLRPSAAAATVARSAGRQGRDTTKCFGNTRAHTRSGFFFARGFLLDVPSWRHNSSGSSSSKKSVKRGIQIPNDLASCGLVGPSSSRGAAIVHTTGGGGQLLRPCGEAGNARLSPLSTIPFTSSPAFRGVKPRHVVSIVNSSKESGYLAPSPRGTGERSGGALDSLNSASKALNLGWNSNQVGGGGSISGNGSSGGGGAVDAARSSPRRRVGEDLDKTTKTQRQGGIGSSGRNGSINSGTRTRGDETQFDDFPPSRWNQQQQLLQQPESQAAPPHTGGGTPRKVINESIIRRLASCRRHKDWKAALIELEALEQEAGDSVATRKTGQKQFREVGWAGTASERGVREGRAEGEAWYFWCTSGLSQEDGERARTTVYNMVLDVLGARKRWQEAFMLVEKMQERGVTIDIFTLNSVLKACAAAGQVQLTLNLLTEMRTSSISSDGGVSGAGGAFLPAPDVVSFNSALAACARSGEPLLALSLLEEMIADNFSGSERKGHEVFSHSADDGRAATAAFGCGNGGRGSGAASGGRGGVALLPAAAPNLSSYNSFLSACGNCPAEQKEDGLDRAFEMVDSMRRGDRGAPSPDLTSYKQMVNACGRAGRLDEALAWLDTAVDDGFKLTASIFCSAITASGTCGEWRRALSVLSDMPRHRVDANQFCYNMALRACADAGKIRKALELLDAHLSGRRGANGFSYSSILNALAREGDTDLAVRLLKEKEKGTGHPANAWHYGAVFLAFLHAGDEKGALAIQSEWRALQNQGVAEGLQIGEGAKSGESTEQIGGRIRPSSAEMMDNTVSGVNENFGGISKSDKVNRSDGITIAGGTDDGFPGKQQLNPRASRSQSESGRGPGTPGEQFEPSDLLRLAGAHADAANWSGCLDVLETAREVSRASRAAVRAKTEELLLENGGSRGGTSGLSGGSGMASWREFAARNSDATDRSKKAVIALRFCHEAAVEALGRAGRCEHALEVLKEGATTAAKHGLRLDPSCFVYALRAAHRPGGGVSAPPVTTDTIPGTVLTNDAPTSSTTSAIGSAVSVSSTNDGGGHVRFADSEDIDGGGFSSSAFSSSGLCARDDGGNNDHGGGGGGGGGGGSKGCCAADRGGDDAGDGGFLVTGEGFGQRTAQSDNSNISRSDGVGGGGMCEAFELLQRMEEEAGVSPDIWCINVTMEAALKDQRWELASALFDEADRRFQASQGEAAATTININTTKHSNHNTTNHNSAINSKTANSNNTSHNNRNDNHSTTTNRNNNDNNTNNTTNTKINYTKINMANVSITDCWSTTAGTAPAPAAAAGGGGAEMMRPAGRGSARVVALAKSDRGPLELRKTAVNPLAPTAVSYHLAMQACAVALVDILEPSSSSSSPPPPPPPTEEWTGAEGGAMTESQNRNNGNDYNMTTTTVTTMGDQHNKFARHHGDYDGTLHGKGGAGAVLSREEALEVETNICFAERALSLVRKMTVFAGIKPCKKTTALARRVCVKSGLMGAALEIGQLAAQMEDKADTDELFDHWRWR